MLQSEHRHSPCLNNANITSKCVCLVFFSTDTVFDNGCWQLGVMRNCSIALPVGGKMIPVSLCCQRSATIVLKHNPLGGRQSLSWQSTEPRGSIGLKKNFGRWFSLQVSPIYEHSISNIAPKHWSNCSKKGVSGSYLPVITLLLEPRLKKQLRALLLDSSKVLFCTDP